MKNFAFCTMTYGKKYLNLGDALISQLNGMGYCVFVLTDNVDHYTPTELLRVIEYKKPYFSFHEKKTVVRECLKHFETAVFLDSDVHIQGVDNLDIFETINPGLHIFANFGDISNTFLSPDITQCTNLDLRNTKYGKEGYDLLSNLGLKYKRTFDRVVEGYLEHFLEGRWVLKRDNGKELEFLDMWDKLSEFCEKKDIELGFLNTIGAGEGSVMSISAYNCGISIYSVSILVGFINKHFISNYVEKVNNIKPWNISG